MQSQIDEFERRSLAAEKRASQAVQRADLAEASLADERKRTEERLTELQRETQKRITESIEEMRREAKEAEKRVVEEIESRVVEETTARLLREFEESAANRLVVHLPQPAQDVHVQIQPSGNGQHVANTTMAIDTFDNEDYSSGQIDVTSHREERHIANNTTGNTTLIDRPQCLTVGHLKQSVVRALVATSIATDQLVASAVYGARNIFGNFGNAA